MPLEAIDRILPKIVDNGLPDGGEFLFADLDEDERTPQLIAVLIWHGFLPMAGMGMLLPKIHKTRCVLIPEELHVGRKVRRRAKGFHLTVNAAWAETVEHIQRLTFTTHVGDCWLTNAIAQAYWSVGKGSGRWNRGGIAFHSIELWHTESKQLVAGEIGYTCGSIYSSATGFTQKDKFPGAGSVQLAALGRWLFRCGFSVWDLGMEMDYKCELGGKLVPRPEWAKRIREFRDREATLASPVNEEADAQQLINIAVTDPL